MISSNDFDEGIAKFMICEAFRGICLCCLCYKKNFFSFAVALSRALRRSLSLCVLVLL